MGRFGQNVDKFCQNCCSEILLARAAQAILLDEINIDLSIPELLLSSNQHHPFYL